MKTVIRNALIVNPSLDNLLTDIVAGMSEFQENDLRIRNPSIPASDLDQLDQNLSGTINALLDRRNDLREIRRGGGIKRLDGLRDVPGEAKR